MENGYRINVARKMPRGHVFATQPHSALTETAAYALFETLKEKFPPSDYILELTKWECKGTILETTV